MCICVLFSLQTSSIIEEECCGCFAHGLTFPHFCCFMDGRQVYYGFSSNFMAWGEQNINLFDKWMVDMNRLLDQEGVLYKGERNFTG